MVGSKSDLVGAASSERRTSGEPAVLFTDEQHAMDPIAAVYRQWTNREWGAADVMASVTAIMRAQQLIIAQANALLAPFGLTFPRYEALLLLRFAREGSLPLKTVGERLMIHPASVTNAIDRLEVQGLVVREKHPTDGRTTLARITDEGKLIVNAATADLVEHEFGVPSLGGDNARHILRIIEELRRALGDFEKG